MREPLVACWSASPMVRNSLSNGATTIAPDATGCDVIGVDRGVTGTEVRVTEGEYGTDGCGITGLGPIGSPSPSGRQMTCPLPEPPPSPIWPTTLIRRVSRLVRR